MTKPSRRIVEDICSDCCPCPDGYCTLREVVLNSAMNNRFLEQIKLVEMFKYERSQRMEEDIGWEQALKLWCDEGYAARFAEVYEDGMTHNELYRLVVGVSE
jgi:hypothetical protein